MAYSQNLVVMKTHIRFLKRNKNDLKGNLRLDCSVKGIRFRKYFDISIKEKIWNKKMLEDLSEVMSEASICGLGQAASNPLKSVMKYFEEEITYE